MRRPYGRLALIRGWTDDHAPTYPVAFAQQPGEKYKLVLVFFNDDCADFQPLVGFLR